MLLHIMKLSHKGISRKTLSMQSVRFISVFREIWGKWTCFLCGMLFVLFSSLAVPCSCQWWM